jgi:hypothetical protein
MIIDKLQMVRPFPLRVEFGAEVRMCRVSPAQKIQNGLGTQVGYSIGRILRNLGLTNPRLDRHGHPALIGMTDLRHSRITYAVNEEKMSDADRKLATRMLHSRRGSDLYIRTLATDCQFWGLL